MKRYERANIVHHSKRSKLLYHTLNFIESFDPYIENRPTAPGAASHVIYHATTIENATHMLDHFVGFDYVDPYFDITRVLLWLSDAAPDMRPMILDHYFIFTPPAEFFLYYVYYGCCLYLDEYVRALPFGDAARQEALNRLRNFARQHKTFRNCVPTWYRPIKSRYRHHQIPYPDSFSSVDEFFAMKTGGISPETHEKVADACHDTSETIER